MLCSNCGKEIPDNSSYCLYCHAPTGLEDDINVNIDILEDDELLSAFQKEEEKKAQKKIHEIEIKDAQSGTKSKKTVIISLVSFISALLVVVVSGTYLNSYSHIIGKANKAYQSGDYETAYSLYEKALTKNSESVDALIGAGNSAIHTGEYDKSEKLLIKALDIDNKNTKAYASLLDLYTATDNQEKIVDAEKLAQTQEMKEAFNDVAIDTPEFSIAGGEFTDDVYLTLKSPNNLQVYYTINGKNPSDGSGTLYEEEIHLTEGTNVVKACCYKNGTFGYVKEETYKIEYDEPPFPTVSPMNGSFDTETQITIKSDVPGAKIYYTWDGSTPTEKSSKYTGPITVIPGNNVLSVVVINDKKKASEVLKCNYTYVPKEAEIIEKPLTGITDDEEDELKKDDSDSPSDKDSNEDKESKPDKETDK